MKRCGECKELDCPGIDEHPYSVACDDFSGEAIEEEPVEFEPTPEAYKELKRMYGEACVEICGLEVRIAVFEKAVAELVRWAQNDETP